MIDNKKGIVSMKKSVRTTKTIHHVQQVLTHSPRKSVKCPSQQLDLGAPLTYRVIPDDVKLVFIQNSNAASPMQARESTTVVTLSCFWRTV